MARFLLEYLLPLLLPVLVYLAYVGLARGWTPGWLDQTPWIALTAGGLALLAASLTTWSLLSGAPPEEVYVPPHLEYGRVIPSTTVKPRSP
jgi:Family of unknown function (DUF6111)